MSTAPTPLDFEGLLAGLPAAAGVELAWGAGERHRGWLALPSRPGPHPVAVVIHGGCWRGIAGPEYMTGVTERLVAAGWATWTLCFRRLDDPGGGPRALLEDVARGADHLIGLAREYRLDADRVVSVGHSSGGHLALWLAARATEYLRSGRLLESSERPGAGVPLAIRGVVTLAGICDLKEFGARVERGCIGVVERLIGDPPTADTLRRFSPAGALPLGVPQLLLSGGLDRTVPPEHGAAWAARAAAAGDRVTHRVIPGAGHFELVAPWTPEWAAAERSIGDFLEEVGAR